MVAIGIDPSCTSTGVVVLAGTSTGADNIPLSSKALQFSGKQGIERINLIAKGIDNLIFDHLKLSPTVVICIEGYALHLQRSPSTMIKLVEVGTAIRMAIYSRGLPWYVVPPSVLKKYATGKGNAKKPEVAMVVEARWGFKSKSDDIVDAYVLAQMATAIGSSKVVPWEGVVLGV